MSSPLEPIFTKAFDLSPNLMAISTIKEGRILHASRSVLKLMGYRRSEVIGRTTRELGFYTDYSQRQEIVRSLREKGSVHDVDISLTSKTGKTRLGIYSAAIVELDHRRVLLSVFVDVTERREIEQKLRESEQRYRLMAEAIPMLAWHCAADGGLINANARWYAYTGQTEKQARGKGWMKALHPADRSRVAETVIDDVKGGTIYQTEYRLRRASDGEYRWHLARALPVREDSSRILAWFGAAADIHEQKCMEERLEQRVAEHTAALRESESRLQRVLEGGDIGYWEWDLVSGQAFMSRRLVRMLGMGDADLITTRDRVRSLVHPDDVSRTVAIVERVIKPNSPDDHYELEHRQCHADGTVVWVHVQGTVTARDASGKAVKVSGLVTDITERKRLETQILETAENEQRRIGNDLHDGLAQVLVALSYRTDSLSESLRLSQNPDAKLATEIADHLRGAVGQTRDIAAALHPVLPVPEGLMQGLENLCVFVWDFLRIECRLVCPRPVRVRNCAVATHLYRIAQEAVQNATKHGRCTSIQITLRQTKRYLTLIIRDNGAGFPAATGKTHGMGLNTMQYRARSIGGELTVQSRKKQGVTVTCQVSLPC